MAAVALTPGQSEALSELREIVRINEGRVRIEDVRDPQQEDLSLAVDMAIDCRGETTAESSVPLEDWEPVTVLVPPRFPFEHPEVTLPHRRFAGLPHVMWADAICLYLAANDWDPGRRMHGFVGQLLTWFEEVARGTITGPEVPWHAPLTGPRTGEYLMIRTDLPESLENDSALWLALAVVQSIGGGRHDVRRWLRGRDEANEIRAWHDRRFSEGDFDVRGMIFLAPAVALPEPVGFAYPRSREELLTALAGQGLAQRDYRELREFTRDFNGGIWDGYDPAPDLLLLGSPAPDRYAIPSRIAHVAAWALDLGEDLDEVGWLTVFDQRPRITTRRDTTRPAQWLVGKRVLVLGCGALGAPTAEFCVRAGAAETYVIDDAEVRPGVLVRQPYTFEDIGRNKATALAERLSVINPDALVLPMPFDAIDLITGEPPMSEVDLVIDATANRSVASALEWARWTAEGRQPPLLSMMVGHDCERAAATLALPGASGAGVDILRRLGITASTDADLHDVLDDFFPAQPRGAPFQPEPGCSDPTYVGSAADLAAFAGQLLNDGLAILTSAEKAHDTAFPRRWASVARTSTAGAAGVARQRLSWPNDQVRLDPVLRYQMRVDPAALASMRREVDLMADRRGLHVETGGMLLGQIDQASRVVWITDADGPPPGSEASAEGLKLDPTAARGWARRRRRLTRGMVAYIGAWHTHPDYLALPSPKDREAMDEMASDGMPVLLMILGGGSGRLSRWVAGNELPDMHLQLFFPDPEDGRDAPVLP
ncbi:ThiF family adenylyltransferase [Micromonospora chersina]|uniref:ThiF family adenylyltransferase n=1 Tax=Micromonospora chersina TaxID=47854 RepID=UPI003408009B